LKEINQRGDDMTISPYALQQDWRIQWQGAPENRIDRLRCESPKEIKALQTLAHTGIMSGKQLLHLYGLPRKQLKKMEKERKLHRHELISKREGRDHILPIYTLGPSGAVVAELPHFQPHYWQTYGPEDVLQRLAFVQLYSFFQPAPLFPAPQPFTGGIEVHNRLLYVYAISGKVDDLLRYLTWEDPRYQERIILIAEKLGHVRPFLQHFKEAKVRITTHEEIFQDQPWQNLFYFEENGELVKEQPNTV